jgi:hypothetical protein
VASSDALAPLAQRLATLPDESVEGLLSIFDSVVQVSSPAPRPAAAQMLHDSAAGYASATRRERLLRAAGDIAARQVCAAPPAQFEAPAWLPPPPSAGEDEEDEYPYLEQAPPQLPHLPVRHFFPGLVVRVAQDFHDRQTRAIGAQDLLKDAGDRGFGGRLHDGIPGADRSSQSGTRRDHGERRERLVPAGAFGGMPGRIGEAIDLHLEEAENEDDEEEHDDRLEQIEDLRADVADCRDWLERTGDRGPAPECRSGDLAAQVFGHDASETAGVAFVRCHFRLYGLRQINEHYGSGLTGPDDRHLAAAIRGFG